MNVFYDKYLYIAITRSELPEIVCDIRYYNQILNVFVTHTLYHGS